MIRLSNLAMVLGTVFLTVNLSAAVIPVTDSNLLSGLTLNDWVCQADSINSAADGASLTLGFAATQQVVLQVDNAHLAGAVASRYPIIAWSVNGGALQTHQLAAGETSVLLASGVANPVIDLFIKGMSPFEDRYTGDVPPNSVKITGFVVDSGGSTAAVPVPGKVWLNIGDSIMSGDAAAYSAGQGRPPDDLWAASDDARAGYGYLLAQHYGYRETRLAYGGYDWAGGLASVPALTTLIDQKTSTISRLTNDFLNPIPNVVLINLGENGAPASADVTQALVKLRSRVKPATKIIVMIPAAGTARTQITQAFSSYTNSTSDACAFLVDLGSVTFATADGQHPTAQGHQTIYQAALPFFDPIINPAPYRVCPVGDSITAGYTDNPNWTVPFNFGYRSGLYTRLTNSGVSFQFVGTSPEPWNGADGTVTNIPAVDLRVVDQDHHEGYGGKTTAFVLSNIGTWLAVDRPHIMLLMAGINDIGDGSTGEPTVTEQNLSNIVYTVVNNSPNTHLIVAQITPYSSYTDSITRYNNYIANTLVPHFAGLGKFVTMVNQYTNLCVPGSTNIDAALFANGINHPNATAYDRMAQTWFAGIQALNFPPSPPVTIISNPPPPVLTQIVQNGFGQAALDGNFAVNLIRAGQSSLASVSASHAPRATGGFVTSGLNDGSAAGTANEAYYGNNDPNGGNLPVTITFNLNTNHATGYTLTRVQSVTGWSDSYLANVKFQLLLSLKGGPFTSYGTFSATNSLNGGNNSILLTVTNTSGPIASGVTAVQFAFSTPPGSQGGAGGTLVRELQVFGTPVVNLAVQTLDGDNLRLTWPQGILLEATNLSGPWTTNTLATSPFTNTPDAPQKYYRVRVQ